MKKLKIQSFIITICLVCIGCMFASAQSKQVQGTVTDDKDPLPGITVIEKDVPTNGTATDINGKFKLTLKGKLGILIVRGLGYVAQEANVNGLTTVTIKLQTDAKSLQEVAILGYGEQKKITLTGSVSSVSGEELRENPSSSLQNTLTGKVTGYISQQRSGAPGTDGATFFVRGVTSYSTTNQPLIIVDDVEFSYAEFSALDANEVASVTILKDASTTAIYGIKGAHGVVLVTTRRGKIGAPSVTFRTEYALAQPTIFPNYLDAYNTALLYNQAQANENNNSASPNPNLTLKYTAADLALFQNGQDPYGHPNVDWKDAIYKKYSTQERENIDVTGGTEKVKYLVSLGFVNQGGLTKNYSAGTGVDGNYDYQRYNYRSNMDITVNKTLKMRVDIFGNVSQTNTPYIPGTGDVFYDYSSYLTLAPYNYPIKNPDGSFGYSTSQVTGQSIYNNNNVIGRLTYGGYNRSFQNNMNLTSQADQDLGSILKGLSATVLVAYANNYTWSRSETRSNFPSFIYDPVANTYTPRDVNIYKLDKFGLTYTPGSTTRQSTLQGRLNYSNTFGENHVTAVALVNRSSLTQASSDVNYNFIPNNTQGITGRVIYDYKQKYLFTLAGSYNGSDRFAADKRYGFFPAASIGWDIAQETFVKDHFTFIDQFKPRASYGVVGSDQIGSGFSYAYLQTYSQTNANVGAASFGTSNNTANGIQEGTLSNPDVTWERTKQLDIGVDYSFFNHHLSGSAEFFNYNTYDILTTRGTVSAIFGQTLPPVNLGTTNNQGWEVELTYQNRIGKDFSYSVKGTYSNTHNKITYEDEPAAPYGYQLATGKPIGSNYMYVWTGHYYNDATQLANTPHFAQGLNHLGDLIFADKNGDGVIDGNDQGYFGKPNLPTNNFGLQFNFKYKGFSVSALFQAATNFEVAALSEAIRPFTSNLLPIHQQAWTPALGDNAKFPALVLYQISQSDIGTNRSTFWSIPGDYLRLRTAEIAYSLPKSLLQKIKIQNVRIYMNGYNLITWSNMFSLYSLDPETAYSATKTAYPPLKTYNIGLSVTF